jgi:hypothetical protein
MFRTASLRQILALPPLMNQCVIKERSVMQLLEPSSKGKSLMVDHDELQRLSIWVSWRSVTANSVNYPCVSSGRPAVLQPTRVLKA